MTHEKYNELQKKMDKLASDFVDQMAEIESMEDLDMTSEWLDEKMDAIFRWANTADEKVLAELRADYSKLKEMLECHCILVSLDDTILMRGENKMKNREQALDDNQRSILKWLKYYYTKNMPYTTVFGTVRVVTADFNVFIKKNLSERQQAEVLTAFAQWAIEQEETK